MTDNKNGNGSTEPVDPAGQEGAAGPEPAQRELPSDKLSALEWLRLKVFPEEWNIIPVAGKATYIKSWGDTEQNRAELEALYANDSRYRGLGVVTGALSGGLIALDIDGPAANARYKAAAGVGYEKFGKEATISWTSGKKWRRQLLYRVPAYLVPQMAHVNTIILREDGEWYLGQGDTNRRPAGGEQAPEEAYEEVVLRFNRCQSVLPQSPHPDGGRYRFLNYANAVPAMAPDWVLDVVRRFLKPQAWLSGKDLEELEAEAGKTLLPPKQIRGWFFSEAVQQLLQPRLEELIFKHSAFDEYGWRTRDGNNPQRVSGCPWHGGTSGTAFQYSTQSGCWDCKACGVGGDVLDFVHKIESGDRYAKRPRGPVLESYVAKLAPELGLKYPQDAQTPVNVQTTETPYIIMSADEFYKGLDTIQQANSNPAIAKDLMADLAMKTGRRMSGIDCIKALQEWKTYKDSARANAEDWHDVEEMSFTIPGLMQTPSQIILHSAPGLGKTSAAMGFARAVLRGDPMTIRGLKLPVKKGKVLWIQNDQNTAKLKRDCEDNGIVPEEDGDIFIVKKGFQFNYIVDLVKWLNEYEPTLVVIDSIGSCSTSMQEQEKDKAFASPLYEYGRLNGEKKENGGFPACTIIWIHHDNAQGQVRGTRYLTAAVDEVWRLRAITEAEGTALQGEGRAASNCRVIEVHKSRSGREGDRLVAERSVDGAFEIWDLTTTERREGGTGDPEPPTMALRILRDRARGAATPMEGQMTVREVWEALCEEMNGQSRKTPAHRSVRRWVHRWVEDGVAIRGKSVMVDDRRTPTYTVKEAKPDIQADLSGTFFRTNCTTTPRAGCLESSDLSVGSSDPSEEAEYAADTAFEGETGVRSIWEGNRETPEPEFAADTPPEAESVSAASIPVVPSDSEELRSNGENLDTTCARPGPSEVDPPSTEPPSPAAAVGLPVDPLESFRGPVIPMEPLTTTWEEDFE